MATKLDLKREFGGLYRAGRKPTVVEVPELQFLMVDGSGDPNTSKEFADAIQTLYGTAYTLKFSLKGTLDYVVMPLEALWSEGPGWHWTAMILQPDIVTEELAVEAADRKPLPARDKLRLESFEEGLCVQVMHIGPYSAETPTIEALHAFAAEEGYEPRGRHHEIYLGDPRRTAPERLKTIIRQPVE